ncbi:hypothetical protein EWM64_g5641 [Hericium alpestre]|uniref:Uncharacterized protein n=1 Tax=Hericium alpestre TaxID=135208 RepID=A0A4Y9ZWE1_9AGAM|nr:hypothetical protein EWM64_g5641 [Hericium alpestre]
MKISLLATVLSTGLAVRGAAIVLADRDITAHNVTDMAAIPAHANSSYALDAEARSIGERGRHPEAQPHQAGRRLGLSLVGVNRQFAMGVGGLVVHPCLQLSPS